MRMRLITILVSILLLTSCGAEDTPAILDQDYSHLGFSEAEAAGLLSLEQIDDYPLYTMHHYAEYEYEEYTGSAQAQHQFALDTACSLFAALADPGARLYGRNFDWEFSPALLLYADPENGYASAAMVDIAYLGFTGHASQDLTAKPLEDLAPLLAAPYIPFDGMNEAGLMVGMASVPPGHMKPDPGKATIGSLGIIRVLLDKAATVDEALEIVPRYNIDFEGGPPVHYLIADAHGDIALVEYYQGEIHVTRSESDWYQATNFLEAAVDSPQGQCWRYDTMQAELEATGGILDRHGALSLLEKVAGPDTQWSVVYNSTSGEVSVVMGREFEHVYSFALES